jgi:hypothetical protein
VHPTVEVELAEKGLTSPRKSPYVFVIVFIEFVFFVLFAKLELCGFPADQDRLTLQA